MILIDPYKKFIKKFQGKITKKDLSEIINIFNLKIKWNKIFNFIVINKIYKKLIKKELNEN